MTLAQYWRYLNVTRSSCYNLYPAQGCNEVRPHPGSEANFSPPYSSLRSFGSKCTLFINTVYCIEESVTRVMTLLGLLCVPRNGISAPVMMSAQLQLFGFRVIVLPLPLRYAPDPA